MIVYCDTSALIKLYVEEAHSGAVATAMSNADAIATSLLAYPETGLRSPAPNETDAYALPASGRLLPSFSTIGPRTWCLIPITPSCSMPENLRNTMPFAEPMPSISLRPSN